nr:MAG TPA: hypothetical protein [Caudoviricetes sp.]
MLKVFVGIRYPLKIAPKLHERCKCPVWPTVPGALIIYLI